MISSYLVFLIFFGCRLVLGSSEEMNLNSNCHTGTFPYTLFTPIQYNENGVVGIYVNCSTCYNFTGVINDDGYFEITESSAGNIDNLLYMNIDSTTGLVTVNETAISSPYVVSWHLLYYNGELAFSLSEESYNSSYNLYYLGTNYDVAALGTNYSTSLVTEFKNGTRYLSYSPDEASTSYSFSTIDHIATTVTSIEGSSSMPTSSTTSEASTSTKSSGASSLELSKTGYLSISAVFICGFMLVISN